MATSGAGGSEDFSNFSYSRTRPESEAARDEARRKTAVRVVAARSRDATDARLLLSVLGLSDSVPGRHEGSPTEPALVGANVS